MGSGSANFPAKRPHMTDPNPNPSPNKFYKKKKHSAAATSPLVVPPGHVSFRLLCHASRIGGVIGKAGAVIKDLQSSTGAKVRIEVAPDESPDRVISIVAPGGPTARISLKSPVAVAGTGEETEVDVSKAQETLLRVFDRILEVAAEGGGIGFGVVSCRVLVDEPQAGAVIGKGGKVVEKMRKDTGCKIRVIKENIPSCAASSDEIIEIEGDVLAVKKGLVAVSQILQDFLSTNKTRSTIIRQNKVAPQEVLPAQHTDYTSQSSYLLPALTSTGINIPSSSMNLLGSSVSYAPGLHHLPVESERFPLPTSDAKVQVKDVVFKLLCANDKIGAVIGKGGTIVQALQKETGANINIGSSVSECDDRVITISASENPESRYSPAQKAVVFVFSRCIEGATEKDSGSNKGPAITTRLLVPANQVGCLIGKGGAVISEIRKSTGASIRLFGGAQVPKCASPTDQVLQISGDFSSVQDALYHATGRIRDNLMSGATVNGVGARSTSNLITKTTPYGRMGEPEFSDYERTRELETIAYDRMRGAEISAYERMLRPEASAYERMLRAEGSSYERVRELETSAYERPREFAPLSFATNNEPSPLDFYDSTSFTRSYSQNNSLNQNLDYLGLPYASDRPPSPRTWTSQMVSAASARGMPEIGSERFHEIGRVGIPESGRGLTSGKGSGYELGSGNKTAMVTNTTVEIVVPENVIGSVYGENGNNLTRLRQISGARVIVHEPRSGTSDRVIVISGTPDETQAAQSLLHAFILTGPSS